MGSKSLREIPEHKPYLSAQVVFTTSPICCENFNNSISLYSAINIHTAVLPRTNTKARSLFYKAHSSKHKHKTTVKMQDGESIHQVKRAQPGIAKERETLRQQKTVGAESKKR